jgi:hypothetical protein
MLEVKLQLNYSSIKINLKLIHYPLEWFLSNSSPNSSSEDEELMTEILEKIRKPFEDLESLILDLDENSRVYYLTETIMVSFLSPDPEIIIQDWVGRI